MWCIHQYGKGSHLSGMVKEHHQYGNGWYGKGLHHLYGKGLYRALATMCVSEGDLGG